jgi:hypothetical protein
MRTARSLLNACAHFKKPHRGNQPFLSSNHPYLIMHLQQAIQGVFGQLTHSLDQLTTAQYVQPAELLSRSSIGQHVRHIIELFTCLDEGYASGTVNYEKRRRDRRIETDKAFAVALLGRVAAGLYKENKQLLLEAAWNEEADELLTLDTNYYREIAYNLEHTIHHMALIKVGIGEVSGMETPGTFGVASSTLKYKKACAQ